jgi:hypothetical protein
MYKAKVYSETTNISPTIKPPTQEELKDIILKYRQ